MSNFKKRAIALASVACVALTSIASCSDSGSGSNSGKSGNNTATTAGSVNATNADGTPATSPVGGNNLDSIKNEDGNVVITPFQSGTPNEIGITPPDADVDLNSADPVSTEPATEIVEVTEANGEKATDPAGNVVTQIVTKPTESAAESYKSKTDSRYCLWIDISKDSDYIFNDQFIKVTFKLKDDIPDRDYAVRFNPDLSSVAGVSVTPDKVVQGTIRVGGDIAAQDVSGETGFVAYGDNVSAKAGDTVDYYINLKNNPGLAAILVWVYFDSNAMEIQSIRPAGEFANFAKTTSGSKPK
ncbi:hypothetical protein [uncultured Ruminococcus sp.]|uniref:hypothetical protein n=1 Tax=uncultured Ruminococcus sp. TaxID=165186 RepID=UPI00260B3F0C|nr:hypothetical protein [uncultured Ruminococcus sp.]